ncbi:MAG: 4Fe-4S dicluster domain-containing protein [Spirochaetales bacterium]|nr:4Fe-4S dicluster domain-containing protein [Spirochaetales bacterium]
MIEVQNQMRILASDLIRQKRVDFIIGYEQGTLAHTSRPCIIDVRTSGPEVSEKLVWNSYCSNNLSVYLQKFFAPPVQGRKKDAAPPLRIGLIVKGCDLRSVLNLIREKQVPRENLILIGLPCTGMLDKKKMEINKDELDIEKNIQDSCLECRFSNVKGVDFEITGKTREVPGDLYEVVRLFEARTRKDRLAYFEKEISRCIRCNACRQACPSCYCRECFADQKDMKWLGSGTMSDTMIYHLIRIFHQAGRCAECDACFRACPEEIDLRTFTRKLAKDVEELFGFVTDFNRESIPPLSTFSSGDSDSFITEPEEGG